MKGDVSLQLSEKMVNQVEKQMLQGDVGKTDLIINKVVQKRENPNALTQIRKSQEDGMVGETFTLFLGNWHEQVPLSCACALMHVAWETKGGIIGLHTDGI